ncbi:TIGR00282 family metallophosphoesterase [Terasakiella sp. A23]|uniref:TIGR00282 family metallophosphoesterase n=1 Tax=Terasakiella sp. FCG-A23 TaxID=3080561 RepID=UPI0029534B39|nr:TIGR00282 family metallophosphoesterase [Terasakiella sp. A23]MDV7339103.1 TIGR00282 family metallophosphoesterase [Terasakiella sp. A23]
MRFLYCGDVMGKSGRAAILENIPKLRERLNLDFVIVNGENAAHGFGITQKICNSFYDHGVDVITLGNHSWDQREVMNFIDDEPRLLRPINYPEGTPGKGLNIYDLPDGRKFLVGQVMGSLFMPPLEDGFKGIREALENLQMGKDFHAGLVDIHAEATSEKMALGHFLDGQVSLVAGTHSHVPTADAQILPNGTAYQTDLGMCGDYNSVIGMEKEVPIDRFANPGKKGRLEPAKGEATLCGAYVETDDATGLATFICPVRIGGRLISIMPEVG